MNFTEPQFFVKSGDVGFCSRQKDVFGQLTIFEKEKNERRSNEAFDTARGIEINEVAVARARPSKRLRSETKQFRGEESIFKRPEEPPPKFVRRNIPDYQRNPHKWTKYSLGDVSQEDMSDQTNTAAALQFLQELRLAKEISEQMELDNPTDTIIFKPKSKVPDVDKANTSVEVYAKSSFRSTKLIMPEYVVGQEKKKPKKLKTTCTTSDNPSQSIKLSHLVEEEDE